MRSNWMASSAQIIAIIIEYEQKMSLTLMAYCFIPNKECLSRDTHSDFTVATGD